MPQTKRHDEARWDLEQCEKEATARGGNDPLWSKMVEMARREVLRATGRLPEIIIIGQSGTGDGDFASLAELLRAKGVERP